MMSIYRDFGFDDVRVKFADRPRKRVRRRCDLDDRAEDALKAATRAAGVEYELNPGEGAFYGPKLEFVLQRRHRPRLAVRHLAGRPEPAGAAGRALRRTSTARSARQSCCTGRSSGRWSAFSASCSSITPDELPTWLAPVQAVVLNITEKQGNMCG